MSSRPTLDQAAPARLPGRPRPGLAVSAPAGVGPAAGVERRGRRGARRVRLDVSAVVGLSLVALLMLIVPLAPLLSPHDPLAQDVARRLKLPGYMDARTGLYLLGTDGLGRDILSRLLEGARVSLLVGVLAVGLSGSVGTLIGLTTGYFGGWWDSLVMRVVDVWQAIPYLILAIAVAVVLGPSLQNLILVLALTTWINYARVVRSETLAWRQSTLVLAARVVGARDTRILLRHVLPQVAPSIIVIASLMVASMILFEASLSFLGLGVQRPTPSWGNMVLDGVDLVRTAWWVSFFPGVAILLAVMGINLVGDWLRDVLDPRQQHA